MNAVDKEVCVCVCLSERECVKHEVSVVVCVVPIKKERWVLDKHNKEVMSVCLCVREREIERERELERDKDKEREEERQRE